MGSSGNQCNNGLQYRLMSPLGTYPRPRGAISVDGAELLADNDLVVILASNDIDTTELFLKAAIILSSPQASDGLRLYGFSSKHSLNDGSGNLLECVKADVQSKRHQLSTVEGNTIPEFDWYENAKGASLPPILGGAEYHWLEHPLELLVVRDLFNRLKQHQCSRLRGALTTLLSSNQMSCHYQFHHQSIGLLLDSLRLAQEIERFVVDSAELREVLSQLGDNAEDYLISRQQMALKIGPKDYHRLFIQSCTQFRKFLLGL